MRPRLPGVGMGWAHFLGRSYQPWISAWAARAWTPAPTLRVARRTVSRLVWLGSCSDTRREQAGGATLKCIVANCRSVAQGEFNRALPRPLRKERDSLCQFRVFPAPTFSIFLTQRTQPARSSSYNKRSNNWGRICRQEISPPRNPTLRLWRRIRHKRLPRHRHQSSNPIAQAFQQLAKDLQSGNLSAAQQDFSTIQQDVQSQGGGHHHHGHGESSSAAPQNPVAELFSELGQALQSGNLSAAQQAYTTLQQDFQQSASSGAVHIEYFAGRRRSADGRVATAACGPRARVIPCGLARARARPPASALIPVQLTSIQVCFAARVILRKYAGGWSGMSWDFDVLL